MKIKTILTFIFGVCILFMMTSITFAKGGETMMEKQQKIDQYIFEDKTEELAEKGITVTHTVALENTIEIGIIPYSEENIRYFQDAFGKDQVTIVEGEQAVTLAENSPETTAPATHQNQEKSNKTYIYITAFILAAAGTYFVIQRRKKSVK